MVAVNFMIVDLREIPQYLVTMCLLIFISHQRSIEDQTSEFASLSNLMIKKKISLDMSNPKSSWINSNCSQRQKEPKENKTPTVIFLTTCGTSCQL